MDQYVVIEIDLQDDTKYIRGFGCRCLFLQE